MTFPWRRPQKGRELALSKSADVSHRYRRHPQRHNCVRSYVVAAKSLDDTFLENFAWLA